MNLLRMLSSTLTTDVEGRSYHLGAPFSGLAYRVEQGGVVCEIQVIEKGTVGAVSTDWLELRQGERLDRQVLDLAGDYGPLVRRGAPVYGVVYFFDSRGACIVEEEYAAGQPTDMARREWYSSGAPKLLLRSADGTAWFEDGRLRTRVVDGSTLLNLVERADGTLGAIALYDHSLFDVASVRPMALSDEVLLIGHGIDTRVLATLLDETSLGAVPRLRLIETSVEPDSIQLLASLAGLRELWLVTNRFLVPGDAENFAARRSECVVHYE